MPFPSSLTNLLTLAVILIFVRSFPFIFDALAKVSAIFALMAIFGPVKTLLRKLFFHSTVPSKNKAVLITGCDSGFGYLLAQRLDQLGYHVFAGCLYPSSEGPNDLKRRTSPSLQLLELDVTSQDSVLKALEFVKENLKSNEVLWTVVNNAGIGQAGEIEWTPMEDILRVLDVNTIGTVRVTKAFLPLLRKSKGRIVNTTSLNGRLSSPGFVGYCMSKSAAVSFTSGLRMEMAKWRVKVISIEPFVFQTPLTIKEKNMKLIENTFAEAPQDIKDAYGKEYLNAFKESCVKFLERCNPNIEEVIQCFEDAITAEKPDPDYFPCYLPHKVILKLWRLLPQPLVETLQLSQMPRFVKPAALCR